MTALLGQPLLLPQERERLVHRQVVEVGDGELATPEPGPGGQHLVGEAQAAAVGAREPGRGQVADRNLDGAHTLARRAGSLGAVEGEVQGGETRRRGKGIPDGVRELRVRRWIRAWIAPNRTLVDEYRPERRSVDSTAARGRPSSQRGYEHVLDERALARARHARDDREATQGDGHVDVLQVAPVCAAHVEELLGLEPLVRTGDAPP